MAAPVTEKFEELVLEVEFDPDGSPGTYSKICGMVDATVTRTANIDTAEVPADCDDESLPLQTERAVRNLDVSISASGVWARGSNGKLLDWLYSGQPLNVRVTNAQAASGDTEIESGPALLSQLNNSRTKGQKVSAEIEIQFDGTPARTAAA
ncbi:MULTISPECIES: phage tail tube protein [Stappiaceae]|uniref:phage tail tube protein n=1 Tax=Stappiaceae TaxID=2821832 RepID=UPI00126795AB|nr:MULTISPECIES: phage tail tube protein [Stappiaceae]MBO9457950.1 hypothetical protein [Labrenzia sp. R5_0]QFT00487.1 Phage major tail protein 2 [Labrenzia sp. THAF191b]QFT06800.1 Phage major tail protein 2 [Labrenzia sp. THAF191a]QFT18344.1 Phage major tail protein 2 [Labrenzia sp. THAF187b]UES40934.1 hypothetical protein GFC08_25615 [Roseibium aggregatum]